MVHSSLPFSAMKAPHKNTLCNETWRAQDNPHTHSSFLKARVYISNKNMPLPLQITGSRTLAILSMMPAVSAFREKCVGFPTKRDIT